jgi:hypothetical protein
MRKPNATESLNASILLLENKSNAEWKSLKEQICIIQESIKPINLIKSAFHKATTSSDGKSTILDTSIGVTTGYITRKLLWGASSNPLIKIAGTLLQIGVSNIVAKHPDLIKSAAGKIVNFLRKKKAPQEATN